MLPWICGSVAVPLAVIVVTVSGPNAVPPVASLKTTVLGVAAVVPAVAPLTVVPLASINPVRFDVVAVVTVFGPVAPVSPLDTVTATVAAPPVCVTLAVLMSMG
jgi:hypothetical protein